MKGTIEELNEIFRDVLDNPELDLTETTTAADVDGWDSLNHIQLINSIEEYYKINFSSQEIHSWKNVADILASIKFRLSK
jgi:acyl carrier protein